MGIGALVAIAAGSARLSATERRRLLVHMCEHMRPTLYRLLAHPQIAVRQTAEATFLAGLRATAALQTAPAADDDPSADIEELSHSTVAARMAQLETFAELVGKLARAQPAAAVAMATPASPALMRVLPPTDRTASPIAALPPTAASALKKPQGFSALSIDTTIANEHALKQTQPQPPSPVGGSADGGGYAAEPFLSLQSTGSRETVSLSFEGGRGEGLLPAFEAEGLLGLCVALLPDLPPLFLLRNWAQYWGVLDRYLAHNASTVRQKCSLFFQQLIVAAPPPLRPALLRLVIQSLSAGWHVDVPLLTHLHPATPSPSNAHKPPPLPTADSPLADAAAAAALGLGVGVSSGAPPFPPKAWQWREGRLLALELVYEWVFAQHMAAYGLERAALEAPPACASSGPMATPLSFRAPSSTGVGDTPSRNASTPVSPTPDQDDGARLPRGARRPRRSRNRRRASNRAARRRAAMHDRRRAAAV